MTYITDTLAKDETLIATGSISKWSLFHVYFAALLFGLSIVLLPLTGLLLLYAWLKIRSTEMGVTSKRVIRKSGVIMRDTSEIRLSKVESVSVNQGFLGRMFNYGTVTIVGTGGNGAVMEGVKDPLAFRSLIDLACDSTVLATMHVNTATGEGLDRLIMARNSQVFSESHETIPGAPRPFINPAGNK